MAGKKDGVQKELSQAAKKSNFTALARMLDEWKDLDLSFVDETGKTLLHHCANAGDKESVQILLNRGIPLDIKDAIGHTAVLYAAKKEYIEVAELLIVNGADTNIPETKNGQTPLHFAVAKNYQGLVQLLLFSGADATARDYQDRMPEKLCRSKEMRSVIAGVAKMTHGNKTKDLCLQTRDIMGEKSTEFDRLDLTIDFTKGQIGDRFQMMCRKQTPEYSDENFLFADTEEVFSDVFSYRIDRKGRPAVVTITIPIFCEPDTKEELLLKTNNVDVMPLLNRVADFGDKFYAVIEVDLMQFDTFVIISRPWRERFEVTKNEAVLTSKNDKRIEIWIPQDTFTLPTNLYFQIMEPANPDLLDCPELEDIYASTPFYYLQTESKEVPSNQIQLSMPLPEEFGVGGHMQLFSGNFDSPAMENEESWEFKDTKIVKRRDKNIPFDMKTLSIKVAVETKDDIHIGHLPKQMSTLYRLSRVKQYQVVFLTMSKRVSNNVFKVAVEICMLDKVHDRKSFWTSQGFINQTPKPTPLHSVKSKQLFKFTVSKLKLSGVSSDTLILLQMHPKRRNYTVMSVQISSESDVVNGFVNVIPLRERPRLKEEGEPVIKQSTSERVLTSLSVELSNDEEDNVPNDKDDDLQLVLPKRLSAKLTAKPTSDPYSKAFTNDDLLHALLDDLDDDWYKLFLLLGVSYADIESALRDPDLDEDDKRLKFLRQWRDANRTRDDLGIPKLLTACAKGGRRDLCTTIQLLMKTWYDEPTNQKSRFWRWVDKAFKDPDLLSPQEYPKPMTDGFLVLLVHEIGAPFNIAIHLAINDTVLAKIKADKILLTDDQKMLKILTMAKGMVPNDTYQQIRNILQALKKLSLKDAIAWFVMSCDYWKETNKDDNDVDAVDRALKGYRK